MIREALLLSFLLLPAHGQVLALTPDRTVDFPGFNAFPLKGSVKAGGAHPYFAVMVAGSGPMDRDWSTPLIPLPSHGGRDLALWLQGQGVGSLRYDKRFIGAKDPTFDVSLDANGTGPSTSIGKITVGADGTGRLKLTTNVPAITTSSIITLSATAADGTPTTAITSATFAISTPTTKKAGH